VPSIGTVRSIISVLGLDANTPLAEALKAKSGLVSAAREREIRVPAVRSEVGSC